jgi:hypothetical protein
MYTAMRRCRNHNEFLTLNQEREDRDKYEKAWPEFTGCISAGTTKIEGDKDAE